MLYKLWIVIFVLPLFTTELQGQTHSLFEIQRQPETQWKAKTTADIQRAAVTVQEDVLEGIRTGHIVVRYRV